MWKGGKKMGKWTYTVGKITKTGGRACAQVRFSNGSDEFYYRTFPMDSISQLESLDLTCQDEIARVEELYKKVDEMQK